MGNKKKTQYTEPSIETVLLKGSDVIVTSPVSDDDEDWGDNTPSGGWV